MSFNLLYAVICKLYVANYFLFLRITTFCFYLDTSFRFIGYIYDMVFLWYKKRSCLYLDTICFMAYICNILKL